MTTIAPGFLHTDGGQIVDSAGRNIKLTGVNWFGAEGYAFAPQGLWMDSYQNHMNKMQALGFNVIRLPFSDAMLDAGRMPTGIDYSKNPDLKGLTSLQVFDKIIDYAGKTGMKIILDHHRSGDGASSNENGLWYTSQYPESKMIENWKMLAQRYAGKDAVIGADLHNEPHGQASWGTGGAATDWARAAERIGNAIQTVNKDWLMIVEGVEIVNNQWYWWGGNLLGLPKYEVNFDTPNKLVYSVHDYGPSLHMMDWFKASDFPNNMPAKWDQMWGNLIKNDQHPVLVGEFGSRMETAIDKAWMPKLIQYMNGDFDGNGTIDLAKGDQGASWTYWAWSPGSGDTGGIMTSDWQVDTTKYNAIKAGLFTGSTAAPAPTPTTTPVPIPTETPATPAPAAPSSPSVAAPVAKPFDALAYVASHADLSAGFGADAAAGTRHYQQYGHAEGRTVSFDPLAYTASYHDLIAGLGTDHDAASRHFIEHGRVEGRATVFDAYNYLAANRDLSSAFGADAEAGAAHYIRHGVLEGRAANGFDTLRYVASNADLIDAFGTDARAAEIHYLTHGIAEGRSATAFDPLAYLNAHADLHAAFGSDRAAATLHYVQHGKAEGRVSAPGLEIAALEHHDAGVEAWG
ncbi:glycoside hydrolase family 5 protein [Azospirillum doebereinerae]|uniref:glycoside hydrolase family 5 protein n=1 Tax=Azospirillum doebereinerae TaxID=92933 RepID=UPI001FCFDAD2|nr:glycoside hydrolase family 5 protein [Azospirillum doebereinerae]